jgi:hypothetical protein
MRENLIKKIEDLIEQPLPDTCTKLIREFDNVIHNARDLSREIHEVTKVQGRGIRKDIELLIIEQLKRERK